jgi:hypothetical protein
MIVYAMLVMKGMEIIVEHVRADFIKLMQEIVVVVYLARQVRLKQIVGRVHATHVKIINIKMSRVNLNVNIVQVIVQAPLGVIV